MPSPITRQVLTSISLAVLFYCAAAAAADPSSTPTYEPRHPLAGQPGVDVLGIDFATEPIERGMAFQRKGAEAFQISVGGVKEPAWRVRGSNVPARGWERAFRFRVTDDAFTNGGRPAVDVQFEYMLDTWAGVQVYASTVAGWKQVGSGWGDTKGKWRTMRIRLDDAWFGDRDEATGRGGQSDDGFDLMIVGANAPLVLRRVELVGYDPKHQVHWPRMLRMDQPRPFNHEGDQVFVYRQREDNALSVRAVNLAGVPRPLHWQLRVRDWLGERTLHQAAGKVTLEAGADETLRFSFDSSDWQLGPYEATVELRLEAADAEPILSRVVRLGVIDGDAWALPKAKDDAFFFGLDAGNTFIVDTGHDAAAAWYALVGVDVLRGLPVRQHADSRAKIDAAAAWLSQQKLRAGLRLEPPKPNEQNAAWRKKELAKRADLLAYGTERYAGRGIGRFPFIELGNEPDLPFFWPGEIDSYLEAMQVMAAAARDARLKAGLDADDILIANGGLSFAGPTGHKRSVEFLRKAPADVLDAVAFHAHGSGIEAERMAYRRLRQHMKGTALDGLPVFDTETGFNGSNQAGLLVQARTVVEKFAYAQSVGMPTLLYFRLFMDGDQGYGMTDQRTQPRPSVLAYRQMVRRLRDHRFAKVMDAAELADAPGAVVYLFHQHREGEADRWTLVAFSEQPAQYEVNLRLAPAAVAVAEAWEHDLFGNRVRARVMPGNVASLAVTVDPVYLSWQADAGVEDVIVTPPLLAARLAEPLPTGNTSKLRVIVRNPGTAAFTGRLRVEAHASLPIKVELTEVDVKLPAGGQVERDVTVTVGQADAPLRLPT